MRFDTKDAPAARLVFRVLRDTAPDLETRVWLEQTALEWGLVLDPAPAALKREARAQNPHRRRRLRNVEQEAARKQQAEELERDAMSLAEQANLRDVSPV